MNKRLLNQLAKTGFFKSANDALYAAVKRALRKPPSPNDVRAVDEPAQEPLTTFGVPSNAVNISPKISLPNARKKEQKQSR
jgi:hypothetical protein